MSDALNPFGKEFSSAFGSGPTETWTSLPVTALTHLQITGLTKGAIYQFRVFAVNAKGSGSPSQVLTVKI